MTTFDPDTLRQDRRVLCEIVEKFGGKLALNCYVIRGGEIHAGDDVQLAENCEHEIVPGSIERAKGDEANSVSKKNR